MSDMSGILRQQCIHDDDPAWCPPCQVAKGLYTPEVGLDGHVSQIHKLADFPGTCPPPCDEPIAVGDEIGLTAGSQWAHYTCAYG